MGVSITAADVIEQVRLRLDYPTFTTATYIKSTDMLTFAKYSLRRLSAIIRMANSDYFLTTTTTTTTPSTATVSLPTNCTDVRQVAWLRSSTESVPLQVAGVDDFLVATERVEAWGAPPLYRLQSGLIRFFPTPSATYTISIYYDTGIFITGDEDAIDAQPGWDEWLVHDIACKCLQREEKDYSMHMAERDIVQREIVAQARQRDRFRTMQVRDEYLGGDLIDSRSLYWRR